MRKKRRKKEKDFLSQKLGCLLENLFLVLALAVGEEVEGLGEEGLASSERLFALKSQDEEAKMKSQR